VITQGTQNIPAFPCRPPGVTAQDAVIYRQMAVALMPGGAGPLACSSLLSAIGVR